MRSFPWDKLLESALIRHGEVILTVGCPPILHGPRGLQPFLVEPLSGESLALALADINLLADAINKNGYREATLRYGETLTFQVLMFGEHAVHTVLLALVAR